MASLAIFSLLLSLSVPLLTVEAQDLAATPTNTETEAEGSATEAEGLPEDPEGDDVDPEGGDSDPEGSGDPGPEAEGGPVEAEGPVVEAEGGPDAEAVEPEAESPGEDEASGTDPPDTTADEPAPEVGPPFVGIATIAAAGEFQVHVVDTNGLELSGGCYNVTFVPDVNADDPASIIANALASVGLSGVVLTTVSNALAGLLGGPLSGLENVVAGLVNVVTNTCSGLTPTSVVESVLETTIGVFDGVGAVLQGLAYLGIDAQAIYNALVSTTLGLVNLTPIVTEVSPPPGYGPGWISNNAAQFNLAQLQGSGITATLVYAAAPLEAESEGTEPEGPEAETVEPETESEGTESEGTEPETEAEAPEAEGTEAEATESESEAAEAEATETETEAEATESESEATEAEGEEAETEAEGTDPGDTATFTILKVDGANIPLVGACFDLTAGLITSTAVANLLALLNISSVGGFTSGQVCDDEDGLDGTISVSGVLPELVTAVGAALDNPITGPLLEPLLGQVEIQITLEETVLPDGVITNPGPTTLTITLADLLAGESATVVNQVEAEAEAPEAEAESEAPEAETEAEATEAEATETEAETTEAEATEAEATEAEAEATEAEAPEAEASEAESEGTDPGEEGATLTILKVDTEGLPLLGACFDLTAGVGGASLASLLTLLDITVGPFTSPEVCDVDDGDLDGEIAIAGILPELVTAVGAALNDSILGPLVQPLLGGVTVTLTLNETVLPDGVIGPVGPLTVTVSLADLLTGESLSVTNEVAAEAEAEATEAEAVESESEATEVEAEATEAEAVESETEAEATETEAEAPEAEAIEAEVVESETEAEATEAESEATEAEVETEAEVTEAETEAEGTDPGDTATFTILKVDGDNIPLVGACFDLTAGLIFGGATMALLGALGISVDQFTSGEVCDDEDGLDGTISVGGVLPELVTAIGASLDNPITGPLVQPLLGQVQVQITLEETVLPDGVITNPGPTTLIVTLADLLAGESATVVNEVEAEAEVVEAEVEAETEAEATESESEAPEAEVTESETEAEVIEAETEAEATEAEVEAEATEAEAPEAETEAEVVEAETEAESEATEAEAVETEAEVTESETEAETIEAETEAEATEAEVEAEAPEPESEATESEAVETEAEVTEAEATEAEVEAEVTEAEVAEAELEAEASEAEAVEAETEIEAETEAEATEAEATETEAEAPEAEATEVESEVSETEAEAPEAEATEVEAEVVEAEVEGPEAEVEAEATETEAELEAEVIEAEAEVEAEASDPGVLELIVVDQNANPRPGAEFLVESSDEDDDDTQTMSTIRAFAQLAGTTPDDIDGHILTFILDPGSYLVAGITAPDGCDLPDPFGADIASGEITSITVPLHCSDEEGPDDESEGSAEGHDEGRDHGKDKQKGSPDKTVKHLPTTGQGETAGSGPLLEILILTSMLLALVASRLWSWSGVRRR